MNKVNDLSSTKDSERKLIVNSIADFDNDPDITLHFLEDNDISKFYLVKGEEFNLSDGDGVWLDIRFAEAKNLTVGDNISFTFEGMTVEKEIKGLGYSPEHLYQTSDSSMIPDYDKMGFAYLSYEAFPVSDVPYNVLLVKYDGNSSNYEKQLDDDLTRDYSSFLPRAQHPSFAEFQDETEQHQMMTDVIPVIFIIISMLTLLTTMTRIINNQRMQIGVLKALGFITLPPIMFEEMADLYSIPYWLTGFNISFIVVTLLMVVLAALISYFACRNIVNESPSSAIRPKIPKVSTSGFLEKLGIWKKFSFNVRWNYRDAKRNKFRALMSIVGVMACTLIIVASFGCMDGFDEMKEWEYTDINHYSSKLVLEDNITASQVDYIADDVGGEKLMESSIEIKSGDIKKSGVITVLDDNKLYTPTDDNKNPISISSNEVSISTKMAQLLGVGVGDTIKWHIMGSDKWISTKVDKIHSDPTSQGIIVSKEKLDDLGLNYTATSVISSHGVDKNYSGVKTIFSMDSLTDSWDDMMESSMTIIYLLAAFASLLSVIVLYNLGLLSFTEIKREFATLKVLGFKSSQLRKLLLTQNLWFTTIGFVIGVPLGREVLQYLWGTMGDSFYLKANISLKTLIITFLITYVVSILVNLMFSGKIKKLNMVESLKDNE